MKMKKALLISICLCVLSLLAAAPAEGGAGSGSTTTDNTKSFSFVFEKPTRDIFDFCAPGQPGTGFQSSPGGGLTFPIPVEDDTAGFPTSVSIGMYCSVQSKCRVALWCNASEIHIDEHRLRLLKANGDVDDSPDAGYDYEVVITSHDGAESDSTAQFPVSLTDPKLPVYQVIHDGVGQKDRNITLTFNIRSDRYNAETGRYQYYMEGQYRGYVLLQYMSME